VIEFLEQNKPLSGALSLYSDQKLSCYSLLLAGLANGKSKISNLLRSRVVLNLVKILGQIGVSIQETNDDVFIVDGVNKNLSEPINVIDVENSEELLYLMIGLLAPYNFNVFFKADDALAQLNLKDIFSVYYSLKMKFIARNASNLPFLMVGNKEINKIKCVADNYSLPIKNSLLLTSLISNNKNVIMEKEKSENHLEVMMKYFDIILEESNVGIKTDLSTKIGKEIKIDGEQTFIGKNILIPTSTVFSNFIAVLAILIPDSNIIIKDVLVSQYRDTFFRILIDMGANVIFTNQKVVCGEKVVSVNVKYGPLKNSVISADKLPKILSEYYLLALIAAVANISITIQGIDYLKEKDAENYKYLLNLINSLDMAFEDKNNTLSLRGKMKKTTDPIAIGTLTDHNLLLAVAFFGFFMKNKVAIDGAVEDTYPNLLKVLTELGLNVKKST
jgi:3-phosphoshikimate 1-carboxyvinyltransferase